MVALDALDMIGSGYQWEVTSGSHLTLFIGNMEILYYHPI